MSRPAEILARIEADGDALAKAAQRTIDDGIVDDGYAAHAQVVEALTNWRLRAWRAASPPQAVPGYGGGGSSLLQDGHSVTLTGRGGGGAKTTPPPEYVDMDVNGPGLLARARLRMDIDPHFHARVTVATRIIRESPLARDCIELTDRVDPDDINDLITAAAAMGLAMQDWTPRAGA